MPYRIFISHSSQDRSWVESIRQRAMAVGVEAYLYEHDPQPGKLLKDKLERAIRQSDSVVVLLSENGTASQAVQQEVGIAIAARKLIIPLVQVGTPDRSLAMLKGLEYIAFDPAAPHDAMSKLSTTLRRERDRRAQQELVALLIVVGLILLAASSE